MESRSDAWRDNHFGCAGPARDAPPLSGARPVPDGLIWLVSYPKSGNTWVRLFLGSLELGRDVDLQRLDEPSRGGVSRPLLQRMLGIRMADLSADEVMNLRPLAYRRLAEVSGGRPLVLKIHDRWCATPSGLPLFPPEITSGCVHVVRDPRDVCLSLAAHNGTDIDDAIAQMADTDFHVGVGRRSGTDQVGEFRGSWSSHCESWLGTRLRRLTIRYEDLVAAPLEGLGRVAAFCGRAASPEAVAAAVERTRFERLAEREAASGFLERPQGMERFFRAGRAGQWREVLSPAQIARIERDHGPMMERLGYLPLSGSGPRASG
ncbi:sulfotransferase domain-containing protein [Oleisolibacter albus]|uniref:sulfotransferase domain-containing protein n=1 Tax=Oleisolibacter albus TaxID=2171757 RepID=UPI000DF4AC15|nr:sulfotransferase domain-containing protein [Oleisolibacter albus]